MNILSRNKIVLKTKEASIKILEPYSHLKLHLYGVFIDTLSK